MMARLRFSRVTLGVTLLLAALALLALANATNQDALPDSLLAATRGSDVYFRRELPASCAANAVSELGYIVDYQGVTYAPACSGGNLDFPCGKCVSSATATWGKLAVYSGTASGYYNGLIAKCGILQKGYCGLSADPANPGASTASCLKPANVVSPTTGEAYLCPDLNGVVEQPH